MDANHDRNSTNRERQPHPEVPDGSMPVSLPSLSSEEIGNLRQTLASLRATIEHFGETVADVVCTPLQNPSEPRAFPLDHDALTIAFEALQQYKSDIMKYADIIPTIAQEALPVVAGVWEELEQLKSLSNSWDNPDGSHTDLTAVSCKIRRLLSADAERLTPQIHSLLAQIDSTKGGGTNTVDTDIS
jgi:hypothetical protein